MPLKKAARYVQRATVTGPPRRRHRNGVATGLSPRQGTCIAARVEKNDPSTNSTAQAAKRWHRIAQRVSAGYWRGTIASPRSGGTKNAAGVSPQVPPSAPRTRNTISHPTLSFWRTTKLLSRTQLECDTLTLCCRIKQGKCARHSQCFFSLTCSSEHRARRRICANSTEAHFPAPLALQL